MIDSEALLKELLATFELEAQDHLGALSTLLLALERENEGSERSRLIETIFRRMHTLKGAAHAVNLVHVAQRCQLLEGLLADLKRGDIPLELSLFDRLHNDINVLTEQISQAKEQAESPAGRESAPVTVQYGNSHPDSTWQQEAARENDHPEQEIAFREKVAGPVKEVRSTPAARPPADETVRVSTRLLESLLLQSEELVAAKLAATVLHEELGAAAAELSSRAGGRSQALEAARRVLKQAAPEAQATGLAGLLELSCQNERLFEARLRLLEKSAEKHLWALQGMVDPLLDDMKKLHLLPFSSLVDPFSKLVRDLSRQLDKEAGLHCLGGELELDRRILAELKEPLLHLVRNMIDHGIEKPPQRRLLGKPEKGNLQIEIRLQDANRAELVVSDDGCGIDLAQVKGAALRLELVPAELLERMPDQELLQLIFESGVSTSRIISSISGRGIGLAIVRETVERLGGHVTVETTPGQGTCFRLGFPLSFAMMRGILVQVAGRDCIIPAASVELTSRVPVAEIRSVENRDTVVLCGEVISLVSLARLLELEAGSAEQNGVQPLLLLHAAQKRIAFAVDQVLGVQEILVKPLGSQLSRVRNVAGATVLGNGRVVPVLNVADLFRSVLHGQGSAAPAPPSPASRPGRVSVLVAEDSITSRTLLKNILESSGYLVRTAIDGLDALTQLKTESFDIVISDVEMPRMDGFQLTAAIRGDDRFASLPVVLVTGLESRADRERGIDVGANAYLVKSSFDQSSLVEVIRKLT